MRKVNPAAPRNKRRRAALAPDWESTPRGGTQGKAAETHPSQERFRYGSTKSLTENPDETSGEYLTKTRVLVVHRTGFVRSGVLSLIAKTLHFIACGETDHVPLARELF